MKLRTKRTWLEQATVDSAHAKARHFRKEECAAGGTFGSRCGSKRKHISFASSHRHCCTWIKGAQVGIAMNRLAIVAVANELR